MTVARVSPALHIVHIVICFATFGFVFPHALMENIDEGKSEPVMPGDPPPKRAATQV